MGFFEASARRGSDASLEEPSWLDIQKLSHLHKQSDARIALAPFNPPDLADIKINFGGQTFLGQPARFPEAPEVFPNDRFPSHP